MSKNLLNLLLIVATVAVYMLAIKPLYTGQGGVIQPEKSIKDLSNLNSQYDNTLEKAGSLVDQANDLRSEYDAVSPEDRAKLAVMVPDKINKLQLLDEVGRIAEEAGFVLNELSYSEIGSSAPGRGSASISFSVKTNYVQFKKLMDTFEKSMRLFSIGNVEFNVPEKEDELTTYRVRLETYFLK